MGHWAWDQATNNRETFTRGWKYDEEIHKRQKQWEMLARLYVKSRWQKVCLLNF